MTDLFAVSTSGGQGQLTSINVGGTIDPVAGLGSGGAGGLAYRPVSSTLYAIRRGPAEPTLQSISLTGQAQTLGSLPFGLDGGLAYHNPTAITVGDQRVPPRDGSLGCPDSQRHAPRRVALR
jgi:hypothetical protein